MWEPIESARTKEILQPGDLALDVGANLGWYTTLMAKAVGSAGRVIAFEPDELNCALLRANLASHDVDTRVTVLPIALFELEGEIVFEHSENNFGDHRVRESHRANGEDLYGEATRATTRVPGRPLDSVLGELGLENHPIKLMKIDTQGAEVAVFRGARKTLRSIAFMTAEFWPYGIRRGGYDPEEYCEAIASSFTRFTRLNSATIEFRPIEALRADMAQPHDYSPNTPVEYSDYLFAK
jgi:FkbM family methyltransferase